MNIQIKYLLRVLKPMNQPQVAEGLGGVERRTDSVKGRTYDRIYSVC